MGLIGGFQLLLAILRGACQTLEHSCSLLKPALCEDRLQLMVYRAFFCLRNGLNSGSARFAKVHLALERLLAKCTWLGTLVVAC